MDPINTIAAASDGTTGPEAWLALAFGLGLMHAFDADHVMAVSVLSTDVEEATDVEPHPEAGRPGRRRPVAKGIGAGLRWSLGHGLVVLGVLLGRRS